MGASDDRESGDHDSAQYRMIFECCSVGIALVGPDGHPLRSNPALERMLGYSEPELKRMRFRDFTHPDDIAADEALFHELVEGVRADYQIEKRYIRKNGQTFTARLTVYRLSWEPLMIVGMVEDTTTVRMLREAEAQALDRLRERVKELTALHEVGRAFQNEMLTIDDMLAATARALPPAFQSPVRAAARVWYGNQQVRTAGFASTSSRLSATFDTSDGTAGGSSWWRTTIKCGLLHAPCCVAPATTCSRRRVAATPC